ESDPVQPERGFAQLVKFNAGFHVIEYGLGIAEEWPGDDLAVARVNNRRIGIDELPHVITRTGPVPVLDRAETGVQSPVGSLSVRTDDVVASGLDLVGGIHVPRYQIAGFPGRAVVENAGVEPRVPA